MPLLKISCFRGLKRSLLHPEAQPFFLDFSSRSLRYANGPNDLSKNLSISFLFLTIDFCNQISRVSFCPVSTTPQLSLSRKFVVAMPKNELHSFLI